MGRKRGWCGGRRRDWKLRWQERNIGTVENVDSDDGKDQGDNEQVQVHLTFDPDTGLYLRERGEQEGGVGPGSRMGAREQEGEHERGVGAESRRGAGEKFQHQRPLQIRERSTHGPRAVGSLYCGRREEG